MNTTVIESAEAGAELQPPQQKVFALSVSDSPSPTAAPVVSTPTPTTPTSSTAAIHVAAPIPPVMKRVIVAPPPPVMPASLRLSSTTQTSARLFYDATTGNTLMTFPLQFPQAPQPFAQFAPPPPARLPRPAASTTTKAQPLMKNSRKLLVLDLNGLLIYRTQDPKEWARFDPSLTSTHIHLKKRWVVVMRPHVVDFLQWLLVDGPWKGRVVIWSSVQKATLDAILQWLLPFVKQQSGQDNVQFMKLLCQDQCKVVYNHNNRSTKPLIKKNLSRLVIDGDVLMVDDSPDKFSEPDKQHLLPVIAWTGNPQDNFLAADGPFRAFLSEMIGTVDMSVVDFLNTNKFSLSVRSAKANDLQEGQKQSPKIPRVNLAPLPPSQPWPTIQMPMPMHVRPATIIQ